MDSKEKAKYRFAIRMVEDGALEAYEDVNLNNDTYPKTDVCKMINGNDVVEVKAKLGFCFELRFKIKYRTVEGWGNRCTKKCYVFTID